MQPAASLPATRTSPWTVVAWVFFALAVVASVLVGLCSQASRDVAAEPYVGVVLSLMMIMGAVVSWLAALACAGLGAICGAVGLIRPEARSRQARAAFALNAAVVAVIFVVMLALPA